MTDFSKEAIFALIQSSPVPVTKREVARAFNIKGGERRVWPLNKFSKRWKKKAVLLNSPAAITARLTAYPPSPLLSTQIDVDGDVLAKPLIRDEALKGEAPRIEVMPDKKYFKDMREGSRALVRLICDEDLYEAKNYPRHRLLQPP